MGSIEEQINMSTDVSKNTMEYFLKNLNCYYFLVKQHKAASELKSMYYFNFFIIYTKYNYVSRVQT